MNHRIVALLLAFVFPLFASAQPTEVAKATLEKLVDAIRTGDAGTVVNLTHPKVHGMVGGREKMLAALTETFRSARNTGHKLDQIVVGQPSPLGRDGKQIFVFFPYVGVSSNNEISTTIEAFYLGVSEDSGLNWKFVDGSRMDQRNIKMFIPSYSGQPPLPSTRRTTERK